MSKQKSPFDFLKQGEDNQFEQAMASVNGIYDNMFSDPNYSSTILESMKQKNNTILQPISEMNRQIFDLDKPVDKSGPQYKKVNQVYNNNTNNYKHKHLDYGVREEQDLSEDNLIIGEPVYDELDDYEQFNEKGYFFTKNK